MKPFFLRPFEYWPNYTHEIPFHLFLIFQCAKHRIGIRTLMKANVGIPYAGLHFASKYAIQDAMGQSHFPTTHFLNKNDSAQKKEQQIQAFAQKNEYPLILKPDEAMTGRGIMSIRSESDIPQALDLIKADHYLLQEYAPGHFEYGVFWYVAPNNTRGKIIGINQKHYPHIMGNGTDTIQTLAQKHERYTNKWKSFLHDFDTSTVPKKGEQIFLSTIGSHTMGSMFTDETNTIQKDILEQKLNQYFPKNIGYHYGRFDIKAMSKQDLEKGDFTIIEANGIESQATHMFDPKYTFRKALKIVWFHAECLANAAKQNQKQTMDIPSWGELIAGIRRTIKDMDRLQAQAQKR